MILGHERVRTELEKNLPPAALILGPRSVGKRTLALHLAKHHGVGPYDLLMTGEPLGVDNVRRLRAFLAAAPFGPYRLALVALDGASDQAQHALLKVLEEPPTTARFLLTASYAPLDTVSSRCQRYRVGFLAQEHVEQILRQLKIPAPRARKAATVAGGQVRPAIAYDNGTDEQRSNVVACMQAVATGDLTAFHQAFTTWNTEAGMLLTTWFTEALTRRFITYSEPEMFGLHTDRDRLMQMMSALTRVPMASPRLQARAALEPFVRR